MTMWSAGLRDCLSCGVADISSKSYTRFVEAMLLLALAALCERSLDHGLKGPETPIPTSWRS